MEAARSEVGDHNQKIIRKSIVFSCGEHQTLPDIIRSDTSQPAQFSDEESYGYGVLSMYLGYDYDGYGTPYARSHQFVMAATL